MSLEEESQLLSPDPIVELFKFDATNLGGGVYYFCSGTPDDPVLYWQSKPYVPLPIIGSGWEMSTQGSLPTPTLKISNISYLMSAIIADVGDPLGAEVTRYVTFEKYLDGESEASPTEHYTEDVYYVERKVSQNAEFVEFELRASVDLEGRMLPARVMVRNYCNHKYRHFNKVTGLFVYGSCPYGGSDSSRGPDPEGPFFDTSGVKTDEPSEDVCGKRLSDCKIRFEPLGVALPFWGFPGLDRIRRQ
jgi:lambda family phage minor tail protein L